MTMSIQIERYHDISCGHRVCNHEGACAGLHGHNYRITFTCAAERRDALGRVVDFAVVKERLCMWLEKCWDHKMLLWEDDPILPLFQADMLHRVQIPNKTTRAVQESIHIVPFNPTAENMAHFLLTDVAPDVMRGTGVTVIAVKVEETRKCSAVATL